MSSEIYKIISFFGSTETLQLSDFCAYSFGLCATEFINKKNSKIRIFLDKKYKTILATENFTINRKDIHSLSIKKRLLSVERTKFYDCCSHTILKRTKSELRVRIIYPNWTEIVSIANGNFVFWDGISKHGYEYLRDKTNILKG